MFSTYQIYFSFRGRQVPALVHQHATHLFVYTSDPEVLRDFTGRFEFSLPGKAFVPGHQHNRDAKDITDLVRGMKAQLR